MTKKSNILRVSFKLGQLKEKFNFVNYVFSCYVYVFLLLYMFCSVYSVSLCCPVYCLCANVYCTTATGCQNNCS